MKAAFRRLSEMGKNDSVPPLGRQPPAVYGEYGVVCVHRDTVPRLARNAKGRFLRPAERVQPVLLLSAPTITGYTLGLSAKS